jgi:hypothetical protein
MRLRPVLVAVIVPAVVAAAALSAGWAASRSQGDARSSLTSALDALPADTGIAGFTDWEAIREHHDLGEASDRDLSTRSVLAGLVEEMDAAYGWSAADVAWEAYGQSPGGGAMVARLGAGTTADDVRDGLEALGYTGDDDAWTAPDVLPEGVDREAATVLQSVALLPSARIVVAAEQPEFLAPVLDAIGGSAPSLLSVRAARDVAEGLLGTETALLQAGALACEATSLADAGADVRGQAAAAQARAGRLVDVTFAGRGLDDVSAGRQTLRLSLAFTSPAQAARQLEVRTALATGPFVGRTGLVEDSLVLSGADTAGSTVRLRFDHDPDSAVYMIGTGPMLFAGCTPEP